jgi:hypothetical protein
MQDQVGALSNPQDRQFPVQKILGAQWLIRVNYPNVVEIETTR